MQNAVLLLGLNQENIMRTTATLSRRQISLILQASGSPQFRLKLSIIKNSKFNNIFKVVYSEQLRVAGYNMP